MFSSYIFVVLSCFPYTQYTHVPHQVVTPYKPSEDIEQTPLLLPPTPTSPDSLQTASGYFPESISASTNHSFFNSTENNHHNSNATTAFNFPTGQPHHLQSAIAQSSAGNSFSSSNPFVNHDNAHNLMRQSSGAFTNSANMDDDATMHGYPKDQRHKNVKWPEIPNAGCASSESPHEYHEISDDEMITDKVFDLGPSLLDEMDFMFRSMSAGTGGGGGGGSMDSTISGEPKSPDFENTNKKNEITELAAKLHRKNSASGVGSGSATLGKCVIVYGEYSKANFLFSAGFFFFFICAHTYIRRSATVKV